MSNRKPSARRNPEALPPIFVHSDIDDLGLTTNAFRVYAHLARRAGKDNTAWPSYATIGEHCFRSSYPKAKEATLRRRAIEAVAELKKAGLITIERRRREDNEGHTSNQYRLVNLAQWRDNMVRKAIHSDNTAHTNESANKKSDTGAGEEKSQ